MSIRIALDNQPDFYTNLDPVTGRIIVQLNRTETVGAIIVKLEGESKTALPLPYPNDGYNSNPPRPPGSTPVDSESHKILYKVQQVFPDEAVAAVNPTGPFLLPPGHHEFPFRFKLPFNNVCSDPEAMSRIGGILGPGGFASGGGLFGGGFRVMDGSKQLLLRHVKRTLPPSLTGFPGEAEIRYYIKVTIQRPGLLRENWRHQIGFRFMPIEEPRPKASSEAFARRPFSFRPKSPRAPAAPEKKGIGSFFSSSKSAAASAVDDDAANIVPPSIEMCAFLPHPPILTCNQPVPLRLVAKKKMPSTQDVYLVAMQIELIGTTIIRCHGNMKEVTNRWVVLTNTDLCIPVTGDPEADIGSEIVLPNDVWKTQTLPNTVHPSFVACNLSRTYALELKLGLSWGKPLSSRAGSSFFSSSKGPIAPIPQAIHLPLLFSKVTVYSGIAPPPEVLSALANGPRPPPPQRPTVIPPFLPPSNPDRPPNLPPRRPSAPPNAAAGPSTAPPYDPLYPPQLGTPASSAFEDAPPSYDEAMADSVAPADVLRPRPAYSGVTNDVNGPSQIPEK